MQFRHGNFTVCNTEINSTVDIFICCPSFLEGGGGVFCTVPINTVNDITKE